MISVDISLAYSQCYSNEVFHRLNSQVYKMEQTLCNLQETTEICRLFRPNMCMYYK